MKKISILGATGSIGLQTLDVIRREKEEFSLLAISANRSVEKICEIINEFSPLYVAMMDKKSYEKVKLYCKEKNLNIQVLLGLEGLRFIATLEEVDMVVTSVVGMIGLVPTLDAIHAGKDIALANKETLVVAGQLVMEAAKKQGTKILPVDSEHSAIFQALQGNSLSDIGKILLTASGGPFRNKKSTELLNITVEDALKHPKWNMGRKISIDSSTLMNKGLEVIEAHWLFECDYKDIQVVVHPESVIHSMVEYKDGSIVAQLGTADMRLPIQYALNYPLRKSKIVDTLDFYKIGSLNFEQPDLETFSCLKLAYDAGKQGGTMPTVLNGANEMAVEGFLNYKISYPQISYIVEECLEKFSSINNPNLEDILEIDYKVREFVQNKYKL